MKEAAAKLVSVDRLDLQPRSLPAPGDGHVLPIPGSRPLATPAVAGETIVIGGGFGSRSVYGLGLDLSCRWRCRLSDDGPSAVVVAGERVVFTTESCSVFVLDAASGTPLWARWLGDPLMSQPAVEGESVVVAYPHADGAYRLAALALADGATRWERSIAADVISAPVIVGDDVYFASMDGDVSRCSLADGSVAWTRALGATSAPWLHGGRLFVSRREASGQARPREGFAVVGLDGETIARMRSPLQADHLDWRVQSRSSYSVSTTKSDLDVGFADCPPPVVKSRVRVRHLGQGTVRGLWEYQGSRPVVRCGLLIAAHGPLLRGLDLDSGDPRWERPLPGRLREVGGQLAAPPALGHDVVVVAAANGDVMIVDERSGERIASWSLGEELRFQPSLANGRVLIGTATGKLVCIETGDARIDGWAMWGGGPGHNGPASEPRPLERAA